MTDVPESFEMSEAFREAWAKKEALGYRYGHDALENVRFGFEIAEETFNQQIAELTAVRDELAKIARTREYPYYLPDFDVSLERINALCPTKPKL